MNGHEIDRDGGLVVLEYPDECWENPLAWRGIEERGECSMAGVKGQKANDPGLIECPVCEDACWLELEVPGWCDFEITCPACEGYGERLAKTMEEWCREYGARAAVPVSYNVDTSQPWIREVDWDDLEEACSILYLDPLDSTASAEDIEFAIADLRAAMEYGYSIVAVEVDPEGDLPAGALDGCENVSVGMVLGYEGVKETAAELLQGALEYLEKEAAEREEWAARGVVTL